jgi:hypothetical protein
LSPPQAGEFIRAEALTLRADLKVVQSDGCRSARFLFKAQGIPRSGTSDTGAFLWLLSFVHAKKVTMISTW